MLTFKEFLFFNKISANRLLYFFFAYSIKILANPFLLNFLSITSVIKFFLFILLIN